MDDEKYNEYLEKIIGLFDRIGKGFTYNQG